jgi:putative Ca2+/H+ antiporter (TMEM165/GDT1 family)
VIDLVVIAVTFAAIFVVELPDKTFIATLVLSTKYRPALVWVGVGLAFAVQTGIAVALGKAASFLPDGLVKGGAAALFLVGSVLLLREAMAHHAAIDDDEVSTSSTNEGKDSTDGGTHGAKVILASFLVLFAAEWGDLSQLLTLSLVARYDDPLSVFIGAWGALLTVSGLAVIAGRVLLRYIPLHVLHYIGAGVCLVLAALTILELAS